jgi:hypothetical protein
MVYYSLNSEHLINILKDDVNFIEETFVIWFKNFISEGVNYV